MVQLQVPVVRGLIQLSKANLLFESTHPKNTNFEVSLSNRMRPWKIEVFKMALYMAFPVGVFHYFNQPEYFEEWVIKTRRAIYPPDDAPHIIELRQAIKDIQKKEELEILKAMEDTDNKL